MVVAVVVGVAVTVFGCIDGRGPELAIHIYCDTREAACSRATRMVADAVAEHPPYPFLSPGWPAGIPVAIQLGETPTGVRAIASPATGRILILHSLVGGPPNELNTVLRHELAHLHLYAATGGRALPRWFEEGYATWVQADRCERLATLRAALMMGLLDPQILDLSRLSDSKGTPLRYALFAEAFEVLVDGRRTSTMRGFFGAISTRGFAGALSSELQTSLATLERQWRSHLLTLPDLDSCRR